MNPGRQSRLLPAGKFDWHLVEFLLEGTGYLCIFWRVLQSNFGTGGLNRGVRFGRSNRQRHLSQRSNILTKDRQSTPPSEKSVVSKIFSHFSEKVLFCGLSCFCRSRSACALFSYHPGITLLPASGGWLSVLQEGKEK